MTEQLNSAPRKRQRRRPAKSCEPCRSRKIKCDRGLPCRPCIRSRASLPCTYKAEHMPVSSRSEPRLHPQPDTGEEAGALPSAPWTPQSGDSPGSIEQLCTSDAHDKTTSGLSHQANVIEHLCRDSQHDSRKTRSLRDLDERLSRVERRIGDSPPEPWPSGKSEPRIKLPHPHLRAEHEKTRLFGKTHWAHSLDQFTVLAQMQAKPYAVVDGEQADASGAMLEAAGVRRRAKTPGAKLLQEPMPSLHDSIPPRNVCDRALDGYLRTYEPMFRILHVPSFMREYESYWVSPEAVQTEFLMKLTMIITIGAIFLPDRSVANEIKTTARNWAYAVQWWLIGPTERDAMSIDGVQVFCLLLLARQASALGGTASIMTEALSKLAFTIGLHIDPRFHPSVKPFESEIRRRLWLTVLELTAITSLNSTLPLLLNVDDYQVPLPSNVADCKLDDGDDDPDTPRRGAKYERLDCSLQLLLAKSLRLRMQVIRQLNDTSREATYQSAIAQSDALQAHCRELAAFMCPDDEAEEEGDSDSDGRRRRPAPGAADFHHKFLDTYFRRLILFLHRPFAHQARRDPRYLPSRKVCLESSLITASHTATMDLAGGALDDFAHGCIAGGGLFKGAMGQDVILGVSLEVVTQLEEEGLLPLPLPSRNNDTQRSPDTNARRRLDPRALLLRDQRRPLVRYLEHVREQWRHVIRLGRPSLKQYLFVSCMLSQIEAAEAGRDARAAVLETVPRMLRKCTALLRESPAYGGTEIASEWRDDDDGDTSPDTIDTVALFGFDFSALDPTFLTDVPAWADPARAADAQTFI